MAKVMIGNNPQGDKGNSNCNGLLAWLKNGGLADCIHSPECISTLDFSAQNLRYREPQIRGHDIIIVPEDKYHLQLFVKLFLNYLRLNGQW